VIINWVRGLSAHPGRSLWGATRLTFRTASRYHDVVRCPTRSSEKDLAHTLENKDAAQRQKAAQIVVNDTTAYNLWQKRARPKPQGTIALITPPSNPPACLADLPRRLASPTHLATQLW